MISEDSLTRLSAFGPQCWEVPRKHRLEQSQQ